MAKLLFFILLNSCLMANSVKWYVVQFKHLTNKQQNVLHKIWYRAKPYNLNYTMCAIAFRESSLGVKMMNLSDGKIGSFGVFHNLVSSVYDRYIIDKPKNKNKEISIKLGLAKRLIDDFDFSFSQSLAELKFWENISKTKGYWSPWRYMVIHYNGGTNGLKKQSALNYYKEITKIIKALRICRKELKLK